MIGLGLAIARPDRPVLVVTGDGEMLMGLGALATIGLQRPPNLALAVFDNGHYGETGMQRSHTGLGLDLAAVARACGFAEATVVTDEKGVEALARSLAEPALGPRLHVVEIAADNPARSLPPRDGVHLKNRLRGYLGFAVSRGEGSTERPA
jgi:thiamine pyrophosphate-dependent acetolactate synthase large subunit-like protein